MLARIKRRFLTNYQFLRRAILLGILGFLLLCLGYFLSPFVRLGKELLIGPLNIFSVVFQKPSELKNDNGRTNILLLGIGDPGHDGPNLTDTMMVASFRIPDDSGKIATISPVINLISIPRDIYFDSLGQKINAAYSIGLSKDSQTGLILAKATVSEVTGFPIHYAVRVDFSVFKDIVDLVGGVDINVQRSFTDSQYPIDGKENDPCGADPEFKCRYQTIHFDSGQTYMDGATALKFVRSRHADGDEGTDFARAARQQLVIRALKDKIFSSETLLNPARALEVYTQFKSHIDTDFDPNDAGKLLKLALNFRQARFKNIVLGLDLLENPPIDDRGWTLLPKNGNWDEVHKYVQSQLE